MVKAILLVMVAAAIRVRLYGVERYGMYIDENAPYHHYRAARVMSNVGSIEHYYDAQSWYPLGEENGGSAGTYPGLISAAVVSHKLLNLVWKPIFGENLTLYAVCVFLPIVAAAASTLLAYTLTVEISSTSNNSSKKVAQARGLCAAGFVSIVPGYVYRSVAGLYDHESLGVTAMLLTSYFWCTSCKSGSWINVILLGLSYGYLSSVWSTGCLFVSCAVPLHVFLLWLTSSRREDQQKLCPNSSFFGFLFIGMQQSDGLTESVYNSFTYGLPLSIASGLFFSPYIRNGIQYSPWLELTMWGSIGIYFLTQWGQIIRKYYNNKKCIYLTYFVVVLPITVIIGYARILPLLERLFTIGFAPNTAVARSVSSTRPTTWAQFFIDLHLLSFLFPAGLSFCLLNVNESKVNGIGGDGGDGNAKTYKGGALFAVSCSMLAMVVTSVRASSMPLLAIWSSIMSAMAVGEFIVNHVQMILDSTNILRYSTKVEEVSVSKVEVSKNRKKNKQKKSDRSVVDVDDAEMHGGHIYLSMFLLLGMFFSSLFYWWHCTWIASNMYSTPSIVVPARDANGEDTSFDDFREAYAWINRNTPQNSKVLAWWDYGYHLTTIANVTTIVDNSAPLLNDRTKYGQDRLKQLSDVSKMFISNEDVSWKMMQSYNVDYVMVVFGGMTGYASDDINNFLWMVNIAKDFDKKVSLNQYLWHSKNGKRSSFSVSKKKAPRKLIESTLYKMCYYGWGNIKTDVDQKPGYDRVRKEVIGTHVNTMKHFEESFTSKHFMVRVFKVKPSPLL